MLYTSGDLAILGAESYNAGTAYPSGNRGSKRGKKAITATVTEIAQDDAPRKRRKASPLDGAGEDDEKRRSRGRPRLEPKDETAQDRRRTQIRLAQRAYRNRKETTIQTLERQAQELEETNAEMNKTFMDFHEFAMAQGLLERMPDVGRQLRQTMQRFSKLTRKSTGNVPSQEEDDIEIERSPSIQRQRSDSSPEASTGPSEYYHAQPTSQPQLFGGFIVTQEVMPVTDPNLISPPLTSEVSSPASGSNLHADYEVITYPTLDNASFPFGFNADFPFTGADIATSSSIQAPDFPSLATSPMYSSLPLPTSFAAQEVTFGRRFQRKALERAVALVNMPNPPTHRFSRAFGFCLLFEPLESIKARLQRGIEKTNAESLNNWEYPFHQLGGAGTRFNSGSVIPPQHRMGNRGTTDIGRPRNGNGYGMGPFGEKVNAARDLLEHETSYLPVLGPRFGGEFYDSDEIEMYLYERGVSIPSGAEYVTIDVEDGAFAGPEEKSSPTGGAVDSSRSESSSSINSPGQVNLHEASDAFSQSDYWSGGGETFFDSFAELQGTVAPGKKRLTVNVQLLIQEMVERAICLGRSPGLKKEDIHAAFWKASKQTV